MPTANAAGIFLCRFLGVIEVYRHGKHKGDRVANEE